MACDRCSRFLQNEAVHLQMAPGVTPRLIPVFALVADLPESCRNSVRNPMCPLHAGLWAFPADLFALCPAVCVHVHVCVRSCCVCRGVYIPVQRATLVADVGTGSWQTRDLACEHVHFL